LQLEFRIIHQSDMTARVGLFARAWLFALVLETGGQTMTGLKGSLVSQAGSGRSTARPRLRGPKPR
jgi:hypothetical protein